MRERVEVLGGALRVESDPEGITRVEATVPLGEAGRG
jgi:signal transduction histidine kinase